MLMRLFICVTDIFVLDDIVLPCPSKFDSRMCINRLPSFCLAQFLVSFLEWEQP